MKSFKRLSNKLLINPGAMARGGRALLPSGTHTQQYTQGQEPQNNQLGKEPFKINSMIESNSILD